MNSPRSKYQVHVELLGTGNFPAEFDDTKAGRPIERRLNRIERVVAAYRGQVDKRLGNGLQLVFDSADAALLAACEMQNRCALLPQLSGNRVSLRIGIHRGIVRQRLMDKADNARETAMHLADLDDGIVLSGEVHEDANPELQKLTQPHESAHSGHTAFHITWRNEIPSSAYGGESFWPASKGAPPIGAYLLLYYGLKTLELTLDNPTITIGRDPASDLILTEDHVSRHHCRIESHVDCIVLTDSSTNGTSIKPDNADEILVKRGSVTLYGKGLLFFGRPFNGERRGGIKYEAY